MITVMLWRLNGSPVVNYALDFEDVEEGAWYTEAVRWAKSEGVASGYNSGKFGPGDALTVAGYAVPAMQWACGSGTVMGKEVEDGMILDPKGSTTRAQMAIMMMRFCTGTVQ